MTPLQHHLPTTNQHKSITNPEIYATCIRFASPNEPADDVAVAIDPNGANAESGSSSSGFGGLGLDGIVGKLLDGGSPVPVLGEGKAGMMSGDNAGGMSENLGILGR